MLGRKHVTDLLFDVQRAPFEAHSITRYTWPANIIVISYFIEIHDFNSIIKSNSLLRKHNSVSLTANKARHYYTRNRFYLQRICTNEAKFNATVFIYNNYLQISRCCFMSTPRLSYGVRMPKCRWNPPTDTACRQMETAPI